MAIEYAGAVDVQPRLTTSDLTWIHDGSGRGAGWVLSRDGRRLRPRQGAQLAATVDWIRELVAMMRGVATLGGSVAAYDDETGELTLVTVRDGRVTRRRIGRSAPVRRRSNVIDLATRRRAISRTI